MRASGILMAVSSLPSAYGIGCFSKEAYQFVDRLAEAGQQYWQVLPLGPTGYGDSPYQSFSTYAGNPYFIDLDRWVEKGWLFKSECTSADWGSNPSFADYGKLYRRRFRLLRLGFTRSGCCRDEQFREFCRTEAAWLDDYALYMALKDHFGGQSLLEWPTELRMRQESSLLKWREELAEDIRFYSFLQYEFYTQWENLKTYANQRGIQIIGDLPIYVSSDSADFWAEPTLFQTDANGFPSAVAGCPPDGFAADGQLWGNPLYDWPRHEASGYTWWIRRIRNSFRLYDVVRLDHFRGFDAYYSIPAGQTTARNGHWEAGPGAKLFDAVEANLKNPLLIAEDLGYMTESVRKLVRDVGYPNMKVLEFAFDSRDTGCASDYLPQNYGEHCVAYTGTHDNQPLMGWLSDITPREHEMVTDYLGEPQNANDRQCAEGLIAAAMKSDAFLCIIPIQDWLLLGNEARMNHPSTLGGNWKWRLQKDQLDEMTLEKIRRLTVCSGRCPN